tara:strand:- start:1947 stop:2702 length:756 start_codon:yes stop_codon:yes gene_type:complete
MPVGEDTDRTGQGRLPRDFDFAGWGLHSGESGEDVFDTENRTMRQLTSALNETVTLNDISELTGHTYANLKNWARRTDDFFPKSVPGSGNVGPTGAVSGVLYRLTDVVNWNDNFEPLKRGRKLVSRKAPTEEESTPKPYDPETDISRNLQRHMETFLSGRIDPDSKWPQRVATREEAPGWHGIHAPGPPPQVPVETGDPRPVEKTMPTEIPKSKKQKRAKDQRRKIEDKLKESKETDEGRDLEGYPGKKFW